MFVDYVPTVLLAALALQMDKWLQFRGHKIKQQYAVRAAYCLIAGLLTIPDILALRTDFTTAYLTPSNNAWWATRWLMCYELYYMIEYADGQMGQNDVLRHVWNFAYLWLAYMLPAEGALHSAFLAFVVCIPEVFSALLMFVWVELDWISVREVRNLIYWIHNGYRLIVGAFYIAVSLTAAIWIAPYINGWCIVFAALHLLDLLTSPWSQGREPYHRCNDWLDNHTHS
jgi:hypothetical protein